MYYTKILEIYNWENISVITENFISISESINEEVENKLKVEELIEQIDDFKLSIKLDKLRFTQNLGHCLLINLEQNK